MPLGEENDVRNTFLGLTSQLSALEMLRPVR